MKVKELIEYLQKMPQDLEVYGYCDHGQCPEKVSLPTLCYTPEITHTMWDDWSSVKQEAEEVGHKYEFVLL